MLNALWACLRRTSHQPRKRKARTRFVRARVEQLELRLSPAAFAVGADLVVRRLGDTSEVGHAIVFFDSGVASYQVLRQSVGVDTDAVVLDPGGDGLREMEAFLAGRHDLTAVGVVAHGAPGEIALGTARLTAQNVANYRSAWKEVGAALAPGGELDLWSCNVASGRLGASLIQGLAAATGAGVAAADHPIGSESLGGSWDLNVRVARAHGEVPFSAEAQAEFGQVLDIHLAMTSISAASVPAGGTVAFTLTALDSTGQPVTDFRDTIQLASTDARATLGDNSLPARYTFAAGDNGAHTFAVMLATAGSQTIMASAAATPGTFPSNPVAAVISSPIKVSAGPISKLAVSRVGSTAPVAGDSLMYVTQAIDQFGNAVSASSGSGRVTIATTPPDPLAKFPVTATLNSSGLGYFSGVFKTAGLYTVTATAGIYSGTSDSISVAPGAANHFSVVAPATVTTDSQTTVTVTAKDQFGNAAPGYNGRVHFTSSDARAVLPADATLAGGESVFRVTLNSAGSQTVTATDTVAMPTIAGSSAPVTTRGLTVTSLTPTATGFTATFSKPFLPGSLALYGPDLKRRPDVTLVGAHMGAVDGSLVIDPANVSLTFKATANGLLSRSGSVVLPDDTYTLTLVSGTGQAGFQDALGAGLDGTNSGGHVNYSFTFTTHYQASATPVLGIPDFARGPDQTAVIKVPNDSGHGIPITLCNAAGATDVAFTLAFSPALLSVSGASSVDATDTASSLTLAGVTTNIDGTRASASFRYHGKAPRSGTLVLGNILATVPQSAAGSYRSKELLQLGDVVINGGAITGAATADGLHVNAYLGDVSGNGTINGLDIALSMPVARGGATGFPAYKLLDPAVVGDIANDFSVDAGAVSDLAAFTVGLPVAVLPAPPKGLTFSLGVADAMLTLPWDLQVQEGSFAAPLLGANSYLYNPPSGAWSYSASSGVSTSVSALTEGLPDAPTAQIAFLRGTGSIQQRFTPLQSGSHTLSFVAAQGTKGRPDGYLAIDVFVVDPFGARRLVGVCLPTGTQYALYTTQAFFLTGGIDYTLALQGVDPSGANLAGNQQDLAFLTEVQFHTPTLNVPQSGPGLLAQAMSAFASHGSITYKDMVGLLTGVAVSGTITSTAIQGLQTIVANAAGLQMPDYVSDLASKVIAGDPANSTFQTLDAGGNVVVTSLGNVQLGSPGSVLAKLVRKWFLGENYPLASAPYATPKSAVLFGVGGPTYTDVLQGGLEDCTVIATLAEAAARDTSAIQGMFIPVGTNVVNGTSVDVWAVRFYRDGTPTYVTVDSELPGGGTLYTHPAGGVVSWTALAEKAYVELNQSGWLGTLHPGQNSYQALANGTPSTTVAALAAISGQVSTGYTMPTSNLITALAQGKLVVLSTGNTVQDPDIFTNNHAYALLAYDASSEIFTLYNPWGTFIYATASSLAANFYVSVQTR